MKKTKIGILTFVCLQLLLISCKGEFQGAESYVGVEGKYSLRDVDPQCAEYFEPVIEMEQGTSDIRFFQDNDLVSDAEGAISSDNYFVLEGDGIECSGHARFVDGYLGLFALCNVRGRNCSFVYIED